LKKPLASLWPADFSAVTSPLRGAKPDQLHCGGKWHNDGSGMNRAQSRLWQRIGSCDRHYSEKKRKFARRLSWWWKYVSIPAAIPHGKCHQNHLNSNYNIAVCHLRFCDSNSPWSKINPFVQNIAWQWYGWPYIIGSFASQGDFLKSTMTYNIWPVD